MDDIVPLEETDPELGELLRQVVEINSKFEHRWQMPIRIEDDKVFYKGKLVDAYRGIGRNDPCPCGSGKKFKKCCNNR